MLGHRSSPPPCATAWPSSPLSATAATFIQWSGGYLAGRIVGGDGLNPPVPFETLESIGEQGAVFDTSGRSADAELVACARLFIQRESLTGTDPESLAMIAKETPELLTQLLALRNEL